MGWHEKGWHEKAYAEQQERYNAMRHGLTVGAVGEGDTVVKLHERAPDRLIYAHISSCGWIDVFLYTFAIDPANDERRHVGLSPTEAKTLLDAYTAWQADHAD